MLATMSKLCIRYEEIESREIGPGNTTLCNAEVCLSFAYPVASEQPRFDSYLSLYSRPEFDELEIA